MARPGGVTVIAVLCFLGGGLLLLGGIDMMAGGGILAGLMSQQGQGNPMAGIIASVGAALGVFFLIFAVIEILLGVGLLKLKEWARITTVVLTGIGTALGLLGLLGSVLHFNLITVLFRICVLAVQIFIILYLIKPEVKVAFQGGGQTMAASA